MYFNKCYLEIFNMNTFDTFISDELCNVVDFEKIIKQKLHSNLLSYSSEIIDNIPIYNMELIKEKLLDKDERLSLMREWSYVLSRSAGVIVLKNTYNDCTSIDEATQIYEKIIIEEKEKNIGGSDHYAKPGANDRIWNSLQKLCQKDSVVFAKYFGNDAVAAVCESYLGPAYQMSSQVNLVHPGGEAQRPHRDYHLGFQSKEALHNFPTHAHDISNYLTLQGAIAHIDITIESGPTKVLPFSQLYKYGWFAWKHPEFIKCFEENFVQLPLKKGDTIFFSPALFHAAGTNTTKDVERMVNLLQISSPFGRTMETINRRDMSKILFPTLCTIYENKEMSERDIIASIYACAEGYAWPTNLDFDPPSNKVPETQQTLFIKALKEKWNNEEFSKGLDKITNKQLAQ